MRVILEIGRGELLELAQRLDTDTRLVLRIEPELEPRTEDEPNTLSPLGHALRARGLRPRFVEIVELDHAGHRRAEIAARLVLSTQTIASYWREIYTILGVHSREELRRLVDSLAG